jgi:thioredoxin 1
MTILIEAFSTPGCSKCARARDALKKVAEDVGADRVIWRDVNLLDEIDYAVDLGIVSPPSIAIDHDLVFPALPAPERFREELLRRLRVGGGGGAGQLPSSVGR